MPIPESIPDDIDNLESSLEDTLLCNRHGSLRLALVRKHYGLINEPIGSHTDKDGITKIINMKVQKNRLTKDELTEIISLYKTWRDTDEFLPMRLTYREPKLYDFGGTPMSPEKWCNEYEMKTGKRPYRKGSYVQFDGERSEWKVKQTIKRGNKPYVKLVKRKLKPITEKQPLNYFPTEINKNRKRKRHTNLLYITGTIDQSLFNGIAECWLEFGSIWNSWVTNIRQQFKGCEYMRTWQSQENGYPHFHALVYIPFDFSVVPWFDKDERLTWRIHNRQKLNKGDKITVRERIKNSWKWGNLDIIAVSDIGSAFKDMVKYITRDLEGGGSDLTNAMAWYFGKQSYSISKRFEESLWGTNDIDWREPTNDDLINAESSNSNSDLIRIEVFPIVAKENLDFSYTKDIMQLDYDPKPPPKIVDYLEKLAFSCKPVKVDIKDGVEIIVYDHDDL